MGQIQAFPADLPSTQKLPWVLPLALVQLLEWKQDVPEYPQHGELCNLTRTRENMR